MATEILRSLKDRLNSPILGGYFVILGTLNWRLWFLAFAGEISLQERINRLSEYLHSHRFHLNFGRALLILAVYLYILPLAINLLRTGQQKILEILTIKEANFEARLLEVKRLGGSCEVLATAMLQDLIRFVHITKGYATVVARTHIPSIHDSTTNSEVTRLRKIYQELIPDTENAIEAMSIILTNNYGKKTVQLAHEYAQIRKNHRL